MANTIPGVNRGVRKRHTIAPNHISAVGSQPYTGGTPDIPVANLDAQDDLGAGTFYKKSVAFLYMLFPWARYPWMTIAGPQLGQAASLHNIWNTVPPYKVVAQPSYQVNQRRSNRLSSIMSHRIKLPASINSAIGGQS